MGAIPNIVLLPQPHLSGGKLPPLPYGGAAHASVPGMGAGPSAPPPLDPHLGFEDAQAPPEHAGAHSHCQKHHLKLKEKSNKHHFKPTSSKLQIYGGLDIHIRFTSE